MSKIILNGIEYSNGITYQELQPVIYSDEEREVGVWRDGKPLYQKTIHITSLPSTTGVFVYYNHNISNFEKLAVAKGVLNFNNGNFSILPYVSSSAVNAQIGFNVTDTSIGIMVGSNRSSVSADVTLQYTKTTDTVGSGSWTPSGVPSVHYSTNEQVVGTWIDGKPLYEKTFDFTGTYSGDQGSVPINMSIADTIFPVNAWGINSGNSICPFPYVHSSANNNGGFFISVDKNSIGLRFATGLTFKKVVFTLRYTKTTD